MLLYTLKKHLIYANKEGWLMANKIDVVYVVQIVGALCSIASLVIAILLLL